MDRIKKTGIYVALAFLNFDLYYTLFFVLAFLLKPGGWFSGQSPPGTLIHIFITLILTAANTLIIEKVLKRGSYLACVFLFVIFASIYTIRSIDIYYDWVQTDVTTMNYYEYLIWILRRDTTLSVLIGLQISMFLATFISKRRTTDA